MKLVHKIFMVTGVSVLGMVAIAISGYIGMEDAGESLNRVYQDRVVPLKDIKEIADLYAVEIVDLSHKARNRSIDYATARARIEKAEAEIATKWRGYLATELVERERLLIAEVEKLRTASVGPINRLKDILRDGDGEQLAEFIRAELYPTIEPLSDKFTELILLQLEVAKEEYEKSVEEAALADAINLVVIVLASLASIVLAFFIARQVRRELGGEPSEVASQVAQIATGDLSHRITVAPGFENSLLGSMEKMRASLHTALSGIQNSVDGVLSTATSLSSAATQVAESSTNQASATSAMAASVEEMTVSINTVSSSAGDAQQQAVKAGASSAQGGDIIHRSSAGMVSIAESVGDASRVITELGEESKQISDVVQVIKEVADQTNLLALNAAIEAARAGEQGRGFAVVADEVRKLAERTAQSTVDIGVMIGKIQTSANDAVVEMQKVVEQVSVGKDLAESAGVVMASVEEDAGKVSTAVTEISNALKEQSQASQEIAKHVESIAQMTDENNAAAAETSSNAHTLQEIAQKAGQAVAAFRL
ncbi:MAG: methyl-accepting chemotaxis protein [Zoogloeaceae bacterium]|jgi:methyl-accepting chemotaxis protein|nr:methyl-accepting chemotaxis protein [Zoogloeaceae bacterium]